MQTKYTASPTDFKLSFALLTDVFLIGTSNAYL